MSSLPSLLIFTPADHKKTPSLSLASGDLYVLSFLFFLIQSQIRKSKLICSCYSTQNIAQKTHKYFCEVLHVFLVYSRSIFAFFCFLLSCIKTNVPLVHFIFCLGRPAAFLCHCHTIGGAGRGRRRGGAALLLLKPPPAASLVCL